MSSSRQRKLHPLIRSNSTEHQRAQPWNSPVDKDSSKHCFELSALNDPALPSISTELHISRDSSSHCFESSALNDPVLHPISTELHISKDPSRHCFESSALNDTALPPISTELHISKDSSRHSFESSALNHPALPPISTELHISLHSALPPKSLSTTTSITKYYALNHQLLSAFDTLFSQNSHQVAYAIGMQFVETALLEISKHGYYNAPRHEADRRASSMQALRVTKLLDTILQEESNEIFAQEKERIHKLQKLAVEQVQLDNETAGLNPKQHEINQQQHKGHSNVASGGWDDYIKCCGGELFDVSELFSRDVSSEHTQPTENFQPDPDPDGNQKGTDQDKENSSLTDDSIKSEKSSVSIDHALFLCGMSQCQKDSDQDKDDTSVINGSIKSGKSSASIDRAFFLCGMRQCATAAVPLSTKEVSLPMLRIRTAPASFDMGMSSSLSFLRQPPSPIPQQQQLDIASLTACYEDDLIVLLEKARITISRIRTYQGRIVGSINGCTVIAPLVCIRHFNNTFSREKDHTLPDAAIIEVIDNETPIMLPEVRSKLGLSKDALIIPSDVHDCLMDRHLLLQDQFVTVVGGNILDDSHLDAFVGAIKQGTGVREADGSKNKKIAATLFLLEHVVAILRIRRGQLEVNGAGEKEHVYWYDIIDSAPHQNTMNVGTPQHSHLQGSSPKSSKYCKNERLRSSASELATDGGLENQTYEQDDYIPHAARIRCLDEESLKAYLRWFACSKFTQENQVYINAYVWDDMNSDFDPRVFQAFVWEES